MSSETTKPTRFEEFERDFANVPLIADGGRCVKITLTFRTKDDETVTVKLDTAGRRSTGSAAETGSAEDYVECGDCGQPRRRCESVNPQNGQRCNKHPGHVGNYHIGDSSGWPGTVPGRTPQGGAR